MKPIPAVPMPLSLQDLWRACTRNANARRRLEDAIAEYHAAEAGFGLSSGRAALWLALNALHRTRPERDVVVLPAYTCPTVGRAVQKAGLRGRCADISLDTFNIDPAEVEACIDERVLAVIAAHMFGLPCHLSALSDICAEHGVYLVEDCAQCVGGRWAGQLVGTYGDVGFLSMGRSKNLRGYEGGVLWVNSSDLVEPVCQEFGSLPEPRSDTTAKLKQAAITILSEPYLWAMAKRFPGLNVGAEDQSFDPHPSKLADWQAALGLISLDRVEEYNEHRRHLAAAMRDALSEVEGLHCQAVPPEAEPTYLRFATGLTEGGAPRRDALMAGLQAANIDARAFYTHAIPDYEWMACDEGGEAYAIARAAISGNLLFPLWHHSSEFAARGVIEIAKTIRWSRHDGPVDSLSTERRRIGWRD